MAHWAVRGQATRTSARGSAGPLGTGLGNVSAMTHFLRCRLAKRVYYSLSAGEKERRSGKIAASPEAGRAGGRRSAPGPPSAARDPARGGPSRAVESLAPSARGRRAAARAGRAGGAG